VILFVVNAATTLSVDISLVRYIVMPAAGFYFTFINTGCRPEPFKLQRLGQ